MNETDADRIVRLCLRGDESAFDLLTADYARSVYSYSYTILRDHAAADEVVQDTFLKVFANARRVGRGDGLTAFVFKVARNLCVDRIRSDSRRREREKRAFNEMDDEPARAASPVKSLEDREMSEAAKAALLKLPEKQRTAVALYVIEGIDCSVIARIMNCSEATVRTHIHRARGMLKKMLDEYSDR